MKVLFSLFLGILIGFANFSNLVAQSDNHQDTGYRVQDKNRLKATNQLTDCRLQVAGSNTIELLLGNLSFQIAQQFRPTTNSELPTTKCNNSGRDLSCYLMMDPDINPQAIEEVIKAVKRGLGNSANKAFLAETISESVFEGAIQGVDSSSAKVGDEPQFTEIATHSSDPIESVSFSDKNSVNPSVESVPTNHQDDPLNFNQGINPSPASHLSPLTKIRPAGQAVTSLALQIFLYNALEHANKTLADLHIDVAAARYKREAVSKAWAQIIPTAERVVQYINNCLVDCDSNGIYPHGLVAIDRAEEALKLRIKEAKNIEKWDSTTYPITADGMESAAKYMVNSLLAEKAGNKFLAKNWIEAAELSIAKNRNPFLHIGLVAKKEEVLKSSSNRGAACYNGSSRSQVDNILALQKGIQNAKDFLAHALSYDDHATKAKMTDSQKMIDLWMQAAEQSRIACVNQVKANLFYSSKNEAQARYLEKAVASAVEKRDQYASIAEYTTNALQAKATGNQELFDLWTLGAKQLQVGGKNGLKIVSSETAKNGKAGHCVNRLDNIADYTVRAAKAQALGNQNLADLWMYAVKQMKVFQEMEVQPILSHIDGIYDAYFGEKDEQGEKESFVVNPSAQYGCAVSDFVRSVERAADEWDKISEYTAQATEARISGNQEIAELCSQAAMHIQTVAENSVQVAFAHINGNWNEIYRLMEVAKSARMTAHYFVKLADYTAKVTDAETKGNQDIADIWKQVIRQARMAAENRMKANQAVSVGNIDEAERIKKTSYLFRNVISNLIKSVEITTSRLALVDYALLKAKKITENRPLSKLVYADEV
ncbi:MAG TPA: hypothetical protein VJK54_06290, partial [Chthoniobacterales bacterium]|nr:hypothetical protein [Chthoniobacterales bacterium]